MANDYEGKLDWLSTQLISEYDVQSKNAYLIPKETVMKFIWDFKEVQKFKLLLVKTYALIVQPSISLQSNVNVLWLQQDQVNLIIDDLLSFWKDIFIYEQLVSFSRLICNGQYLEITLWNQEFHYLKLWMKISPLIVFNCSWTYL